MSLEPRPLRLAFFGTPGIAATLLKALIASGEDHVVLAVCQPDRPRGRGRQVEAPAVKHLANEAGIEVTQPIRLRDGVLAQRLRDLSVDLAVVCAYGRILPEELFRAPPAGAWNIHTSLLPKHRGASPITHAILHGDAETGVSLMQLSCGLDEGPILLQRRMPLAGDETTESLTETLATLGAASLLEGLRLAKSEGLTPLPQDDQMATYAPLLDKSAGRLDFAQEAVHLERRVRAFEPWPGAHLETSLGPLRVHRAAVRELDGPGAPGTRAPPFDRLVVHTASAGLEILELRPAGRRRMTAAEFLRGAGQKLQLKGAH